MPPRRSPSPAVQNVETAVVGRRVTRSQSREVDDVGVNAQGSGTGAAAGAGARPRSRGLGKGTSGGANLDAVVEESPIRQDSPRKSKFGVSRLVDSDVHELTNISPTTIRPLESDHEIDFGPEAIMDALPELERRATEVLNFLVPPGAKPFDVVSAARQLADPKNTQSRRLQRFKSRLESEMQVFGNNTYIDVDSVKNMLVQKLPATITTGAAPWTPEPILQRANCAIFALQVLLAHNADRRRVVQELRDRFPAPLMVGSNASSSLLRDTLDLALGIRTQWLVMQLEVRQNEDSFDPEAVLADIFYDDDESGELVLSGFSFGSFEDENRHLPKPYHDAVERQIDRIRMAMEDDDGLFNIQGLKSAFRWGPFGLEAASWIRKRDDEIAQELDNLQDIEDVVDVCHFEWGSRGSASGTANPSPRPSTRRIYRESVLSSASPARSTSRLPAPSRQSASRASTPISAPPPQPSQPSASAGPSAEPAGSLSVSKRPKPRNSLFAQSNYNALAQRRRVASAIPDSRHSDLTGLASQINFEQSASPPRRQTLPAQRTEIPQSPGLSPAPPAVDLFDYDAPLSDDDKHLDAESTGSAQAHQSSNPANQWTSTRHEELLANIRPQTSPPNQSPSSTARSSGPTAPRHFIDRQRGAQRISSISQDSDMRSAERQPSQSQTMKRAREETENEEDSEDDFSRDSRLVDTESRRARKPHQSPKRRRVDDSQDPSAQLQQGLEEETRAVDVSPPMKQPTPVRRSASPRPREDLVGNERKRFTEEEDQLLIDYVEKYGVKWAMIKDADDRAGGTFRYQTQVQLKDRSRNIKIKIIRGINPAERTGENIRQVLPKNFQLVTLSQADKRKLGI